MIDTSSVTENQQNDSTSHIHILRDVYIAEFPALIVTEYVGNKSRDNRNVRTVGSTPAGMRRAPSCRLTYSHILVHYEFFIVNN